MHSTTWTHWNLGSRLKEAYTTIDSVLGRAITEEDIFAVLDPPLSIWETSQEISILVWGVQRGDDGQLVDQMMHLLRYISSLPDLPGTDRMEQLRQRVVRLDHHVRHELLQEARTKQRELSLTHIDDDANDVLLLQNWAQLIYKALLDDGTKTINKEVCHEIPRIFDILQGFNDLKFSTLVASKFPLVLGAILDAPCIPNIWGVTSFRTQAAKCLIRWAGLPEAQTLTSKELAMHGLNIAGIESQLPSSIKISATSDIVTGREIAETLEKLEKAAADMDADGAVRLVKKIEALGHIEDPSLATGLKYKVLRISSAAQLANIRIGAARSEISVFSERCHRRLAGFSYHEGAPDPPVSICFRNTPTGLCDLRGWEDVFIECPLHEPLQRALERFIAEANRLNRHPFYPVSEFYLSSRKGLFFSHEVVPVPHNTTLIAKGNIKFVQGRVSSVHFSPNEYILYYYMRSNIHNRSRELSKFAPSRILPPSCVPPPNHWYTPLPPNGPTDWYVVNTLAFACNEEQIWPYATYPPVIASHIYIPKAIKSVYRPFSRQPVRRDVTPFKLYPPLTVDQAKQLVGSTIQYEEKIDPFAAIKGPTVKKRKLEDGDPAHPGSGRAHTVDWDHTFVAFVWGFDPGRMELKTFEVYLAEEVSRTMLIGPQKTEFSVSDLPRVDPLIGRLAFLQPFRPLWLGPIDLSSSSPDEESVRARVPIGAQEHANDRLSNIIKKAPREFEVGIGGDFSLLVGEIGIQGPESILIPEIVNCKAGIWESGCSPPGEGEESSQFSIWVQWIREGTIDLNQPVNAFGNTTDDIRPLPTQLVWSRATEVSVDGGTVTILARGIMDHGSIIALTGEDSVNVYSFVECIVLPGAEDKNFHIIGGVSCGTGSDGTFSVDVASDDDGKIIAVKVSGPVYDDEEQ